MRASRSSRVGGEDKDHSESMSTVCGSSGLNMAGAFDVSSSRDVRPLEVKDDAHSGLLARVRGFPYPRAMRASQSSMARALDVSFSQDARLLEVKDDAHSSLLARMRGSSDSRVMRASSRSSPTGGGTQDHLEGVLTLHGSSGLGMARALDVSSPPDAH
eukprot:1161912-Pleurochrysis_carterae.AAC.1